MKLLPKCAHCNQWPHGAAACCNEYDGKEYYDRKEADAEIAELVFALDLAMTNRRCISTSGGVHIADQITITPTESEQILIVLTKHRGEVNGTR